MAHFFVFMCSYSCEVAYDICIQWLIESNLFVSVITKKGKVSVHLTPKPTIDESDIRVM